jgi:hypothetical protein
LARVFKPDIAPQHPAIAQGKIRLKTDPGISRSAAQQKTLFCSDALCENCYLI